MVSITDLDFIPNYKDWMIKPPIDPTCINWKILFIISGNLKLLLLILSTILLELRPCIACTQVIRSLELIRDQDVHID